MHRPPVQARSRRSEQNILKAVHDLLAAGRLETVSVAEIARTAGVSVGGFYARFPTKAAAVIELCDQAFLDAYVARAEETFQPGRWEGAPVDEILHAYMASAVETFRINKVLLAEVARWSRASSDPAFRARVGEFGRRIHAVIRPLLMSRAAEISHPDPGLAVDLGMIAVAAVMREVILFGDERPDLAVPDARLADELTALFMGYLGGSGSPRCA